MPQPLGYAIGQQDFKMLREGTAVYVDKTRYIRMLVDSDSKFYFLARPRRFGKSLFLSALRYFFEGRRELFKGLYVDTVDWGWQWEKYPVLRLDLNTDRYADTGQMEGVLDRLLRDWEEEYGVNVKDTDHAQRFASVIAAAHERTGLPVIILVDEYDKPLVGNLNDPEKFEHYRSRLASLYSNFKSGAEHIRMVFLTGVSRFSKLSVFSDLNNIRDLTLDNAYADICGITEKELEQDLGPGIADLAEELGVSYEEARRELKKSYDGYRFAENGSDIYNPWSVLNALASLKIDTYWADTGMPTIIAEALKRINANLEEYFDIYCSPKDLKGLDLLNPDPVALMYQTGYLTIKDYDPYGPEYHLGIPNREVREALLSFLVPYYVTAREVPSNRVLTTINRSLRLGDPQKAMEAIRRYFAGVDYSLRMENENNFHNAFFLLMDLIGLKTEAESHTSDGRIDILIQTARYVYVIELKYDGTAEEALRQTEEKEYSLRFQAEGRKVFRIGASFSSKTRRIDDWLIAEDETAGS
ncbi:MAG: ATP-binding protein [Muribaculaceae bacterium]|nr:ATP-binding protein [Muribaculaceae bacterium]